VLHFDEARLPLLDEAADHVAREDQEPRPRHQRQQRVAVESRQHVETLHVLVEEHQGDDEHPRKHRKTPAAIEAGEDHRQIVKAQERKLLVHEGVNRYQAEYEHEHEDLLEVAEYEQLGALHRAGTGHGTSGRGWSDWGATPKWEAGGECAIGSAPSPPLPWSFV